jgi:hypothetical protein
MGKEWDWIWSIRPYEVAYPQLSWQRRLGSQALCVVSISVNDLRWQVHGTYEDQMLHKILAYMSLSLFKIRQLRNL